MRSHHTVLATVAAACLTAGAVVGLAPAAGAVSVAGPSTCTAQERADLKATIEDARATIAATRLTDEQRAAARDELRSGIASLKEAARAQAGGAPLSTEQKAQLRTDINALVAAYKDKVATRHSTIASLKETIVDARTKLRACHA